MQNMEKERTDKYSKNSLLSQSYSESIEKIIGTDTNTECISIPGTIVHEREQYWSSLIQKYSNLSDGSICNVDTLGQEKTVDLDCLLMSRLPVRKSPSFIQYWINTGNYPFGTHVEKSEYSDSGSSLSERELSSLSNSTISKHLNKGSVTQIQDSDSSSTSVDTTAYILSNTNITQKAKITTILEDAKHSTLMDAWNNSARKMDHAKNGGFGLDNRDLSLDTNGNCSSYSCTTLSPATGDRIALNKSDAIPNHTTFKKVIDINDLINECRTVQNDNLTVSDKGIAEILMGGVENIKKSLNNKYYSQSTELIEQHNKEEENNTCDTYSSSMKLSRRKKLYSGRDSPVDLAHMKSRYEDKLSQTRKSLHPALCPTKVAKQRLPKKRKLISKIRNDSHFAKKNCLDNGEMRVALEKDYIESDDASQKGNADTRECEDMDMNIKTKCSIVNNFVENQMLSSSNGKQHNNMIPSSNEFVIQNTTGETTSVTKRPSINLTKSHRLDLNPVIRLTRLSACEIDKYRTPTNFDPKVRLIKLSELDTQNYKANKHKTALLSQIIEDERARLSSNVSTTSILSTRIQNVDSDDTAGSSQATLLLYQCNNDKGAQRCTSSSSVCIDNNSQEILYNSKGQSKDRDNTFRGTKAKSNNTDKRSFVRTLSDPLRRTIRKLDKNKEMEDRGEFERGEDFESNSEYSNEFVESNNKSEDSRVVPKETRNNDKNCNAQNNSSVDQRSKRLSNKLTISLRSSDAFSTSLGSKISDEFKLIGNHSSLTNAKTYGEKREKDPFVVTSSDENEEFIQRLRVRERLRKRSKTRSTNRYTKGTIDEENSMRGMSVRKQPQNMFVKLLQNKIVQSVNIRDRDRLDTQEELRQNDKNNSARESLGNNSQNKTIRRHRKYYRIVSSSDESKLTDSTHSEIEKSFKGSNKKKSSLRLRTESTIGNHPDAIIETSKNHRSTRSAVSRKIFKTRVFDVSTDSLSSSSD